MSTRLASPDAMTNEVQYVANLVAQVPVTRLAAMRLATNQTCEDMGQHRSPDVRHDGSRGRRVLPA